ncbi:MAG: TetR family transcriptional regulator, partial [Myxococcales bacterium]|nr:TetR family transcriptional regulator [Myxococcales bacterium]
MARPTTIDDEVILEAARQVFLEEGYAATTASIARRAGV